MSAQQGGAGSVHPADEPLEQQFRSIRIIGFGLAMGLMLTGLVFCLVAPVAEKESQAQLERTLSLVLVALVAGAALGQFVLRKSFLTLLREQSRFLRGRPDPLREVMLPYRAYLIKAWGLMQGTGLFASLAYMLTEAPLAILVWGAIIVYYFATIPTEDRARRLVRSAIDTA